MVKKVNDAIKKTGKSKMHKIKKSDTEDLYLGAFGAAKDGISIVDGSGKYLDANQAYCEMIGFSHEEIIGKSPITSLHPDYRYQLLDEFIPKIAQTGSVLLESVLINKDGEEIPIEVSGVRFSHLGRPAFLAITRDITVRKQAEAELVASEERYRFLTENIGEGVMVIRNGNIVFVNRACAFMFGHKSKDELLNKPLGKLSTTDLAGYLEKGFKELEVDLDGSVMQIPCNTIDGRDIWVEVRYRLITFSGKPAILVALTDISERRLRQIAIEEEKMHLIEENIRLKFAMKDRYRFGDIVGRSAKMQGVYDLILKASASDANVAIYGDSGTGKELIARSIHQMSHRKNKLFVPVNCGAIPEKLFESEFFGHKKGAFTGAIKDKLGFFDIADGGTLFLDEVGELCQEHQVKLLRAIEGSGYTPVGDNKIRKPDVRIVTATNRNPHDMLMKGLMREDFFYRIHIITVNVPSLKERKEDIPLLIEHFHHKYGEKSKVKTIPGKVLDALSNYEWPGNVRELENVMQRYLTVGELNFPGSRVSIDMSMDNQNIDVKPDDKSHGLKVTMDGLEKQYIVKALEKFKWHRGKTSEYLGIPQKTLYRKIKKYHFDRK